jgi:diguanylate cyclase (GGDEF)-like protein/PAS domain S-box-containing protein
MTGLWRELFLTLAIVASIATVWALVRDTLQSHGAALRATAFGFVFGVGAGWVIATVQPAPAGFGPEPFYGFVATVAYFAGPGAALITAMLTLAADAASHGPRVVSAVLAVGLGLAGLALRRNRDGGEVHGRHIVGLAVIAAVATGLTDVLATRLADLDSAPADVLAPSAVAFLATGAAALLIWRDRLRRRNDRTGHILSLAVDNLPDCLSIKDVEGRFLLANPATAALLGARDADSIVGRSDFDFFPRDVAERYRAEEELALKALEPMKIEQSVRRPDGSLAWFTTLKAPVFAASGTLIGLITHNRDITHRKQLESELAESRQRLDDALTLMEQGLVMFDVEGRIVYCNERYAQMFPLTSDMRKAGTRLVDIIRVSMERGEIVDTPPEDGLEAWYETLSQALRRDGLRTFKTHQGRWLESHVRATANGGCHIVVSDVTERVEADAKLRAAEERWSFALESAGQGVWDFDLRTNREYHSPTWKLMLGYEDHELEDHTGLWLDLMHPDDKAGAIKSNDDHIAGLSPMFEAEFRMRHKAGHWIWVLDRGKVIETDETGRAIRAIGTHTDITASKEADAAVRANEARFRSLFELAPVGIALADVGSGRLVTHNPTLSEMLDRSVGGDRDALVLADILADPSALPPLAELCAAGRVAPIECEIRRGDGSTLPVIVTGSPVQVQEEAPQIMLVFQDVSMRRGYEERLWQLANVDSLTGLPNRMQFNARLDSAIERSRRTGQTFAVAFFDLDNFKEVNDSFGHGAGDQLLAETAGRVRRVIRTTDTLARVGGDEFAAILDDVDSGADIIRPLEAMIAAINLPVDVAGAPRRFSTSIGVALFPGDAGDANELMKNADIALYRAKQAGRNRFEFFRPELRRAVDHRARLIGDAENALNHDRVGLAFEPIVGGHGSRCAGLAVLPVLRRADGTALSDQHLAAALSDANIAEAIGRLMRRRAIAVAAGWRRIGLGFGRLAFDLSPADLRTDRFVDDLLSDLAAERLEPTYVSLRVASATLTARGAERIAPMLGRLHDLGVELVLAGFGAGPTSMALLQDMPIDWVSFDRELIARLEASPTDQAIVIGLVDLVHRLGIATGAAGVGTVFQADFLMGLGCEQLHGPLFSTPLDATETRSYLERFGPPIDDDLDHVEDIGNGRGRVVLDYVALPS